MENEDEDADEDADEDEDEDEASWKLWAFFPPRSRGLQVDALRLLVF